jgi:hypothetical protein
MGLPNTLPFPLGSTATQVDAGLVGTKFRTSDGKTVRLCKTATALTAPASMVALYTITGGEASFAKVTVADAVNATTLAGVIDPALSGSVAENGYFWVYCGAGDEVDVIGAAAIDPNLIVGSTDTGGGGRVASIGGVGTAITAAKLMGALGITIGEFTAAGDIQKIRLYGPC